MSNIINQFVGVDSCYPHTDNYNRHPPYQIERLRESLRIFEQVRSIVVQDDGQGGFVLVAGEGLWTAAKIEGLERLRADVIPPDWPAVRVKAYVAADNELARLGDPDLAQLAALAEDIASVDEKLAALAAGTEERLRELVGGLKGKPPEDPGPQVDKAAELQEKWGVQTGDLWVIPSRTADGEHRVICGDCTDAAVVEQIGKTSICFTSPPYNAGVSAQLSGNTSIGDNLYRDAYDDNKPQSEWFELMRSFTEAAFGITDYVFVNLQILSGNKRALIEYWYHFIDKFADVAIWDKRHAAPQQAQRVMDSRFEFILIFSKDATRAIGTREFRGMVHNVYEGQPQRHNDFASSHAATYPVDLPEHFIDVFTNNGDLVYDPFLGTGTTLVACERLGRLGRGVEIELKYVAVTLERLSQMGLSPQRMEAS